MIHLSTGNLSKISSDHGLGEDEIMSQSVHLEKFLEQISQLDLGFYRVIDDSDLLERVKKFAADTRGQYDDVVVLGIGGSALGTICLQQSLKHLFSERIAASAPSKFPRLMILDNIDPILLTEAESVLDLKRTLFIVVTKSGSTPETIAQYLYFRSKCDEAGLQANEHFVFITDPKDGFLRKLAGAVGQDLDERTGEDHHNFIPTFEVPQNVGGRFSVLTAVGLLPATLIGIDVEKLLDGARTMRDLFLSKDSVKNMPFQLATIQYLLYQKVKIMNVMIPYSQKLVRFADWYRQLLAESIGKKVNRKGEEILVGITPINALGVTDQHSQSQLYNEGPNDKLHLFLKVQKLASDLKIPNLYPEEKSLEYLNGVSFNELITTEMEGTKQALTQNDRPNLTIEIEEVDEYALGELFMLFEGATAFLGEFFDIDAFDQPGVELSKQITKKLLGERKN